MFVEKKITTIYSHRQTTSKLLKSLHPFQMCINTLPYTEHTRTNPNSKIKSDSLNWQYSRHALKWELTFISAHIHIHTKTHMPLLELLSDQIILKHDVSMKQADKKKKSKKHARKWMSCLH